MGKVLNRETELLAEKSTWEPRCCIAVTRLLEFGWHCCNTSDLGDGALVEIYSTINSLNLLDDLNFKVWETRFLAARRTTVINARDCDRRASQRLPFTRNDLLTYFTPHILTIYTSIWLAQNYFYDCFWITALGKSSIKKPVIVSGSAFKLYVKHQLNNQWDGFEQRPESAMFICATAYVIAAVLITITVVLG